MDIRGYPSNPLAQPESSVALYLEPVWPCQRVTQWTTSWTQEKRGESTADWIHTVSWVSCDYGGPSPCTEFTSDSTSVRIQG